MDNKNMNGGQARTNRRSFLKTGAIGAGALMAGLPGEGGAAPRAKTGSQTQPNFLYIMCDQLGLDAVAGNGSPDVHTPNIDRLIERGVTFTESHSTNPVCSPARSSLVTGRMPVETGVITNSRPIHDSVPNMGQWLRRAGYDTVHCGKWHLPGGYPTKMPGFDVIPVGGGQGDLVDTIVSRSCETYLKNRGRENPFLLIASFMQPHDICYWAIRNEFLVPKELPFPQLRGMLPELPPNHTVRPKAPAKLDERKHTVFSEEQWRYYLYIYARQVEMVDADIGRVLDALDEAGYADNTVIVLTSDHGDGRGRHQHVSKWYPYDEAMKVPMIVSCPGTVAEGMRDETHLVSGLDVMSTVCDYAGIAPPPDVRGRSLRPLLEGKSTEWREFAAAEVQVVGRMLRTDRYKYVRYEDDPVEQLFDMKEDPWETRNLYEEARCADILSDHRKLLQEWEASLKPVEPTHCYERGPWQRKNRRKGKAR